MKCYVYVVGMQYYILAPYLRQYKTEIEILALVTTEPQDTDLIDGMRIIRPWEMDIAQIDYVIVAIEQYKEVIKILEKIGGGESF